MLRVGGITPLSTVDFPGQLCCVLFCQGCPWRCSYCHNTHLIPAKTADMIPWQSVEDFLTLRIGLLDAVVFSGGEPTAQATIVDAVRRVRDMGFRIGLHTGGAYADRLRELLPLCDWVALDVKALTSDYAELTGSKQAGEQVLDALDAIITSGVTYEVRTTVDWRLLPEEKLQLLSANLQSHGVNHYAIQFCRTAEQQASSFTPQQVDFIRNTIAPRFTRFELRDSQNSFAVDNR